ncbi:MAG: hypothetical protein KGL92_05285 [Gammaproteobacteria bacterium]|nr:hypothetical protein [Gammaproteobacteria bacterium]
MHENEASGLVPRALTAIGSALVMLTILMGSSAWARADPQPTAEMMRPVSALVAYMSALPTNVHPDMFASPHPCIVENFSPYVFCGPRAARRWEMGFRLHSSQEALSRLSARFGAAHDFDRAGNRVYFSLPTVWTGFTAGRAFVEHGAWAFVEVEQKGAWRIQGYGWGVYAYQEGPIH